MLNERKESAMEHIGDRLSRLLKESGYTQKEFASMCGVTEAAMCRYLKNEREPKIEVVANMATALNTTVEYLIRGKKDDTSFEDVYRLVSRSTITMTDEEKLKLIKLLMEK